MASALRAPPNFHLRTFMLLIVLVWPELLPSGKLQ
jgi:hypothetical protein